MERTYSEGYDRGHEDGYNEGYEDGKNRTPHGEVDIDAALDVVKSEPKKYKVLHTKTLEDQLKADLLNTVFEKMSLNEVERIFSRHQRKLFGYTLIH